MKDRRRSRLAGRKTWPPRPFWTSAKRAYTIILLLTIGAIATTAAGVTEWDSPHVWGVVAVGALTFAAGMAKAPRDGELSDAIETKAAAVVATVVVDAPVVPTKSTGGT